MAGRHIGIDEWPNLDCSRMTGKPETTNSSVGLVPRNALVLTELATFRVIGKQETDLPLSLSSKATRPDYSKRAGRADALWVGIKEGRCESAAAEALFCPALVVY